MSKIFVEKDVFHRYNPISKEQFEDKVLNHGYVGFEFEVGETTITLIWINFVFGYITEERVYEEVKEYLEYVSALTGLAIPEEVDA